MALRTSTHPAIAASLAAGFSSGEAFLPNSKIVVCVPTHKLFHIERTRSGLRVSCPSLVGH